MEKCAIYTPPAAEALRRAGKWLSARFMVHPKVEARSMVDNGELMRANLVTQEEMEREQRTLYRIAFYREQPGDFRGHKKSNRDKLQSIKKAGKRRASGENISPVAIQPGCK